MVILYEYCMKQRISSHVGESLSYRASRQEGKPLDLMKVIHLCVI